VTGGALLQTRIGPIFVGGSFAEGGRRRLYFSLGRFFLLRRKPQDKIES